MADQSLFDSLAQTALGKRAANRLTSGNPQEEDLVLGSGSFDERAAEALAMKQAERAIETTPRDNPLQATTRAAANAVNIATRMPTDLVSAVANFGISAAEKTNLFTPEGLDNFRGISKAIADSPDPYLNPLVEATATPESKLKETIVKVQTEEATARNRDKYFSDVAAGKDSTIAGLAEFGRNWTDSAAINISQGDLATTAGSVAGSLGGFMATIPAAAKVTAVLARPVEQAINNALIKRAATSSVGPQQSLKGLRETEDILNRGGVTKTVQNFSDAGVIGGTTGVGAAKSAYDEIMNLPDEVIANSEDYKQALVDYKGDAQKAREATALRISIANGSLTDLITGAVAAKLGIGSLARNPVKALADMSVKDALKLATASSFTEDQLQTIVPGVDLNRRIKEFDPNRSLFQDVGEAAGAVVPFTALGAATHAPGLAKSVGNAARTAFNNKVNSVKESASNAFTNLKNKLNDESPTSTQSYKDSATAAQADLDAAMASMAPTTAAATTAPTTATVTPNTAIDSLVNTSGTPEGEVPVNAAGEPLESTVEAPPVDEIPVPLRNLERTFRLNQEEKDVLTSVGISEENHANRPYALAELLHQIGETKDPTQKTKLLSVFKDIEDGGRTTVIEDEDITAFVDSIPEDHPAKQQIVNTISARNQLNNMIKSTPDYFAARKAIDSTPVEELIPADINGNNAQEVANVVEFLAQDRASEVTSEQVNTLLKHSTKLKKSTVDTLNILKEYLDNKAKMYEPVDDNDLIGKHQKTVYTDLDSYLEKAVEAHAKKDIKELARTMGKLRRFAEGQNNKLIALDESAVSDKPVHYTSYGPIKGKELNYAIKYLDNDGGNRLASSVQSSSKLAVDTYNNLLQRVGYRDAPLVLHTTTNIESLKGEMGDIPAGTSAADKPVSKGKEVATPTSTPTTPEGTSVTPEATPTPTTPESTATGVDAALNAALANIQPAGKPTSIEGQGNSNTSTETPPTSVANAIANIKAVGKGTSGDTGKPTGKSTAATGTSAKGKATTGSSQSSAPKSGFTLKGKDGVDTAVLKNDQARANLANTFIGYGVTGSNTAAYAKDAKAAGVSVNPTKYSKDTVAFVSVAELDQAPQKLRDKTIAAIKKVIAAGGTVLMHSATNLKGARNENIANLVSKAIGKPAGVTKEGIPFWGRNPDSTATSSTTTTTPQTTSEKLEEPAGVAQEEVTGEKATEEAPTSFKDKLNNLAEYAKEKLSSYFSERKESKLTHESVSDLLSALKAKDKRGYAALENILADISEAMEKSLNDFIKTKVKGKSLEEASGWYNARPLLLAKQNEDGSYSYDSELVDTALLGAIDYIINEGGAKASSKDIKDFLKEISKFKTPLSLLELFRGAKRDKNFLQGMSSSIQRYLNIRNNSDVSLGLTEGLISGLAAEMLEALVKTGYIKAKNTELQPASILTEDGNEALEDVDERSLIFLSLTDKFNNLIDKIQDKGFIRSTQFQSRSESSSLKPIKEVSNTILRNPFQELTEQQKKDIRIQQSIPFRRHTAMASAFAHWGSEGLIHLFGNDIANENNSNINHLLSVDGKNTSIVGAWEEFQIFDKELAEVASNTNQDINDIPRYFKMETTSVGRTMQVGNYTPQGSIPMRYLLMSTVSEPFSLNDTGSNAFKMFQFGQAQAFGKDKKSLDENIADYEAFLAGDLAPAYKLVKDAVTENADAPKIDAKALKSAFSEAGITDIDPRMVHALIERAKSETTTNRENFVTTVHVESDGKTNGPWNLIRILSTGSYTKAELDNLERGGLKFGNHDVTLADSELVDLYNAALQSGNEVLLERKTEVKNLVDTLNSNKTAKSMLSKNKNVDTWGNILKSGFMHLIQSLDNISFNEDGTFETNRNFYKNPMTVLGYFSSAFGVAGKMTKNYTDNVYAKLSEAAALLEKNATPEQVTQALRDVGFNLKGFNNLVRAQIVPIIGLAGELTFIAREDEDIPSKIQFKTKEDLLTFTFDHKDLLDIQNAANHYLAEPMTKAIHGIFGETVMENAGAMVAASNIMVGVAQAHIKAAVKEELANKKQQAKEGKIDWKERDFLSPKEIKNIVSRFKHFLPVISEGGMEIMISKFASVKDNSGSKDALISSSFGDGFTQSGSAKLPANPGVSIMANTIIAMGDGKMQMNMLDRGDNSLGVYDGQLNPVTAAIERGMGINEVAMGASQSNPFESLSTQFKDFIKDKSIFNLLKEDPVILEEVGTSVLKYLESKGLTVSVKDDLPKFMKDPSGYLDRANKLIDDTFTKANESKKKRIEAEQKMSGSVDQMAGTETPYNFGSNPEVLSNEEAAQRLNVLMGNSTATTSIPAPTNVRELFRNTSGSLADVAKALLDINPGVTDSINITVQKGVDHLSKTGDETVHATYDPATNTINIAEGATTESKIHETVHALTFASVLAHYEGKGSKQVASVITRLENLLKAAKRKLNANDEIMATLAKYEGKEDAFSKAALLNEFMAWGLSNKDLAKQFKETKAAESTNPLKTILKRLTELTRSLLEGILGKSTTNNIYDNLVWNTASLITLSETGNTNSLANQSLNHMSKTNMAEDHKELRKFLTLRLLNAVDSRNTITKLDAEALKEAVERDPINALKNPERFNIEVPVSKFMNKDKHGMTPDEAKAVMGVQYIREFGLPVSNDVAEAYGMNEEQKNTFELAITALALETDMDSSLRAELGNIHSEFLKQVTPELMEESVNHSDPYVKEQYGLRRFNVLTGTGNTNNKLLLPTFMALALTSPQFRNMLSNMSIKSKESFSGSRIDKWLASKATTAIDNLSIRLAGFDSIPKNMEDAVSDAMNIWEAAVNREADGEIPKFMNKAGEFTDKVNTVIKEAIRNLGTKLKESDNSYAKAAGLFLTNQEELEKELTTMATSSTVPAFRSFVKDLLGRTESNGDVYDLIKAKTINQKIRQRYRAEVPKLLASKFSKEPTKEEWKHLNDYYSRVDVSKIDLNKSVDSQITESLNKLKSLTPNHSKVLAKIKQLAHYRNTGEAGKSLLRNAYLINEITNGRAGEHKEVMSAIEKLVELHILKEMDADTVREVNYIRKNEPEAIAFIESVIKNNLRFTQDKHKDTAGYYNGLDYYIPNDKNSQHTIILADTGNHADLLLRGFKLIRDHETQSNLAYYMNDTLSKPGFNQGLIQSISPTFSGLNVYTGKSTEWGNAKVDLNEDVVSAENLVNLYDDTGKVIGMEWLIPPDIQALAQRSDNLAHNLGVWMGRKHEESLADAFNQEVKDRLVAMYKRDMSGVVVSKELKDSYIDISKPSAIKDIPIRDALSILPKDFMKELALAFNEGGKILVRKDLLEDVIGIRSASITDSFTGISRWSPGQQKEFRNVMIDMFGRDAYVNLAKAERAVQGLVKTAVNNIVIRSLTVPYNNIVSNIGQLKSMGIPIRDILKGIPKYIRETNAYVKAENRIVAIELELESTNKGEPGYNRLIAERDALHARQDRLSISPLIDAGEFNTIADIGVDSSDMDITSGRLDTYFNKLLDKASPPVKEFFRQGLIMKDTALFKGLEKTVLYGDFVAKAILHEHLTKNKKLSSKSTLKKVTDAFVHYDLQMGRDRQALEKVGLLWFYNYKIRSLKTGLAIMRDNPVNGLLAQHMLSSIDGTGTPVTDNVLMKGMSGSLPYSIGPGMGLRGLIEIHPTAGLLL